MKLLILRIAIDLVSRQPMVSLQTGAQVGVFQVAIVWGLGIATAIYLTAALSGASKMQLFGLVLLFLTGVGPLIAWRKATVSHLRYQFFWPSLAAAVMNTAGWGLP